VSADVSALSPTHVFLPSSSRHGTGSLSRHRAVRRFRPKIAEHAALYRSGVVRVTIRRARSFGDRIYKFL